MRAGLTPGPRFGWPWRSTRTMRERTAGSSVWAHPMKPMPNTSQGNPTNEARNLLVEAYEKTHDAKGIALVYGGIGADSIPAGRTKGQNRKCESAGQQKRAQACTGAGHFRTGASPMCRPRENNGVGLRRQHRLPVWFSWMKKVKATLRRLLVRSSDALDTAIQFAFHCVSPHDCFGWFRHTGYCLF